MLWKLSFFSRTSVDSKLELEFVRPLSTMMPVSQTGLVPASFKRQMDELATPEKWRTLPRQPKQPLYPFRGDFVNKRNKALEAKKLAKSLKKQSRVTLNPNRSKSLSPKLGRSTTDEPKWDSYCQHISAVKLSNEEEQTRKSNKEKFVSLLRSRAAKRQQRVALEEKLKAELGIDDDKENIPEEVAPPKRKPPVPRLSGRSKANNVKPPSTSALKESPAPSLSNFDVNVTAKLSKVRYLDFISKERPQPSTKTFKGSRGNSNETDLTGERRRAASSTDKESSVTQDLRLCLGSSYVDDNDDDTRFRKQIERIVERAAEMVVAERTSKDTGDIGNEIKDTEGTNNDNASNHNPISTVIVETVDSSLGTTKSLKNTIANEECPHLSHMHERLSELEGRLRSVSSNTFNYELEEQHGASSPNDARDLIVGGKEVSILPSSSDSSQISEVTFQMPKPCPIGTQRRSLRRGVDENSCSRDSSTEIVPRTQIQPTQVNFQHNMDDWVSATTSDPLRGIDVFSLSTFQPSDERETTVTSSSLKRDTTQTDDVEPPGAQPPVQPTALTELQLCDLDRAVTSCPEEAPLPLINPYLAPSRECDWGEIPMPRGYELHENEDGCLRDDSDGLLADDLFSLLG